jgi:hypothetical protein
VVAKYRLNKYENCTAEKLKLGSYNSSSCLIEVKLFIHIVVGFKPTDAINGYDPSKLYSTVPSTNSTVHPLIK